MTTPKILHIEDTLDTATLAKRQLEKNGMEVFICLSGKQGLKMVDETLPDLILLDVELPDMDGFEVCRQLRKKTSTPIIFLTATNSISEIQKGLMAGGDDYITKPYLIQDLVARIYVRLKKSLRQTELPEEDQSQPDFDDISEEPGRHKDVIAIMSSDDGLSLVYDDHLAKVIHSLKLTTTRIDGVFSNKMSVPKLLSIMYYAKLIIVDTTSSDPGVFYALGAAHALGKAVVILAKNGADAPIMLHDDQYLIYDDTPDGRQIFESNLKSIINQIAI